MKFLFVFDEIIIFISLSGYYVFDYSVIGRGMDDLNVSGFMFFVC